MKVCVKDNRTGQFLGPSGEWTTDIQQACDFKQTIPAIRHCAQKKLLEVSLILLFGITPSLDVQLEPFGSSATDSAEGQPLNSGK
jgi:hypothetical protein